VLLLLADPLTRLGARSPSLLLLALPSPQSSSHHSMPLLRPLAVAAAAARAAIVASTVVASLPAAAFGRPAAPP
jgi:hypothetical protein